MSTSSISSLDHPPVEFADQPFSEETLTLLREVREHDFDTLAGLCDDDFGIVDTQVVDQSNAIHPPAQRPTVCSAK